MVIYIRATSKLAKFLTILAGIGEVGSTIFLLPSFLPLPPPRREGYCRELCSRKMHLRFEGQEQIEETLVANEDKHGGGREKL